MASALALAADAPAPAREFILKVASRCNLNCDYCYEYQHGDDSWRSASKLMKASVYNEAARKIAAHARQHQLDSVGIGLHGGEPLLLGAARLAQVADALRSNIEAVGTQISLGLQTNAALMTDEIASVIRDCGIFVGISIDGDRAANDRHRLDHRGKSSYGRVMAGVETLRRIAPQSISGILAVIDIENDPIETFDALASLDIENIDFLFPHHNWDRLPTGHENNESSPYGRWLGAIWNAWVGGRHSNVRIRFLDNIVARLVGHPGLYEQMTEAPVQLITISTDGDFEGVDTLKSTGSGIQRTGLNVLTSSVDDVMRHQQYLVRQDWQVALPTACAACKIRHICTGGYMPHRYKTETGFNNPSVYCRDIQHIVDTVETTIRQLVKPNL